MTINSGFSLPANTSNPNDISAVDINIAFQYGWFADPIVFGRYPSEMTNFITNNRLPSFNASMSALLKGSFDFLGLNYYSSSYVS